MPSGSDGFRDHEADYNAMADGGPPAAHIQAHSQLDLDVTVLAFAQWTSELKSRQHNSQHQMQAELSMIRNAITSNKTELSDFKRHGAAIQQQMQSEINEIRELLSNVFMEITSAVRNSAAADQEVKLKIQGLNEQAIRNETFFAQLADAANQSQLKLRNDVKDMQISSEQMRNDLLDLSRQTDSFDSTLGERAERIQADSDLFSQDVHLHLERRKEHLKKMVNDVVQIGESLQTLVADFTEQRRSTNNTQTKLQATLYALEHTMRRDSNSAPSGAGLRRAGSVEQQQQQQQQQRFASPPPPMPPQQLVGRPGPPQAALHGALPVPGQLHMHPPPLPMPNVVYR